MSEEKLDQILSKLGEMGEDITELKTVYARMDERIGRMDGDIQGLRSEQERMDENIQGLRSGQERMDENIEDLKDGQKVLTEGQKGLRKEIDIRFKETNNRFDYVDRQLRLIDADFAGVDQRITEHDRDIRRLKHS